MISRDIGISGSSNFNSESTAHGSQATDAPLVSISDNHRKAAVIC